MAYQFYNLFNEDSHVVSAREGIFTVVEYTADRSVSPELAMTEYFMGKMGVRRRQVVAQLDGQRGVTLQAGAMQWTAGNVNATSGVKGAGDLFGKMLKGAVTKESTIKPEYRGMGVLATEPTYKYLLLEDVSKWPGGMVMEDGMFLACDTNVSLEVQPRTTISSALAGGEGLFNTKLVGNGVAVLESNVPREELITIDLNNDVLKIDGSYAVCWSASLTFTVERSGRSLVGSAVSGEGLVNVFRGTGRVLMAPVTQSGSFTAATGSMAATPRIGAGGLA